MLAYSAAKHALALGETAGTLKGLNVVPRSYLMKYQPRDVTRIINAETRWLQDGKVSQWAQNDFSGGAYQEQFLDPTMFFRCQGMLPSKVNPQHLRTCQSLEWVLDTSGTPLEITKANYPNLNNTKQMVSAWGALFLLGGNDYVYALTPSGYMGKLAVAGTNCYRSGTALNWIQPNETTSRILFGYSDGRVQERSWSSSTIGSVTREWKWDLGTKTLEKFDTAHKRIDRMCIYGAFVVVAMKDRLYYFSSSSTDATADGDGHNTGCPWTYLGEVTGSYVRAFETHRSELYIMSLEGDGLTTSLDMTTLVAGVLQWQSIPYMFSGQYLKSYAGRLYVGGLGIDVETGYNFRAELYELTGNSLRELRVFYDFPGILDGGSFALDIPSMTVFEGLLYFQNREGLEAYDFITDSFYTAYQVNDQTPNTDCRLVLAVGGNLYVWVVGSSEEGLMCVPRGAYENADCWMITSEFAVEPSILKRWGFAEIHTKYGSVLLSVSTDGGETFDSITRTSLGQAGFNFVNRFDLSEVDMSATIKLKITFEHNSYWARTYYYYRELREVVVGFILDPPKLRQWDFGVVVAEDMALLDGERDLTCDVDADVAQFHTWYENGTVLLFKDRDGTTRQVVITRLSENERIIDADGRHRVDLGIGLSELSLV